MKKIKTYIYCLILTFWSNVLLAAHNIPISKIEQYKKDGDFDYKENNEEGLWEKFARFLNELFGRTADSYTSRSHRGFLYFVSLLILTALVYALYKYFSGPGRKGLLKPEQELMRDPEGEILNIHEINLEKEIQNAESNLNYRLAYRFQILKLLKVMADKEIINWQPQKTNHEYVYEVNQYPWKENFTKNLNLFDIVWYGERPMDQSRYQLQTSEVNLIINAINH